MRLYLSETWQHGRMVCTLGVWVQQHISFIFAMGNNFCTFLFGSLEDEVFQIVVYYT